jgi:hypothetical protein
MAEDETTSEDYEHVTSMADRLGLKDKERTQYIHEHMTGLGYEPRTSYHRSEDKKNSSGSNRFGMGSRRRASGDDGW